MDQIPGDARPDGPGGQFIGPYRIVERIGRGGTAVVYKAMQPKLNRHVAVKVLSAQFAHDTGFRERFQREAELVATLNHPNILPIYDYGQHGDMPYIVMPYVAGGTLGDWLEAGPVPLDQGVQVVVRVLSGLGHAHGCGVVHRDVKPANILMSRADWPLLTDFGIAKLLAQSAQVTRPGMMVGTPQYMAPEQTQGSDVDGRADLYAIGVMLFRLLVGQPPFSAPTPLELLLQHVHEPVPSLRTFDPTLPPGWDEVVQRAMAKRPADRFQTAEELAEALQRALRQTQHAMARRTCTPVDPVDSERLYATAERALVEGSWERVVALCGRILEQHPEHPGAVALLVHTNAALRAERAVGPLAASPSAQGVAPRPGTLSRDERSLTPRPVSVRGAAGAPPRKLPDHCGSAARHAGHGVARSARAVPTDDVVPRRGAPGDSLPAIPPSAPDRQGRGPLARRVRWLLALGGLLGPLLMLGSLAWMRVADRPPAASAATPEAGGRSLLATTVPTPTAEELFGSCQAALAVAAWDEARQRCEAVRQVDADHPGLAAALARAHVGQGKVWLAGEDWYRAERSFQRAAAADPTDAEAPRQLAWLKAYRAGAAALATENWPTAAEHLEEVYGQEPDYLEDTPSGGVREKLFAARLGWGRALLGVGDHAAAKQQCQRALDLKPNHADASACWGAATTALPAPRAGAR